MRYRSKPDIFNLILECSSSGATRTGIMCTTLLSYAQIKKYVKFLLEMGLLTYEEGTRLYRLTEKGLHVRSIFEEIGELLAMTDHERETLEAAISRQKRTSQPSKAKKKLLDSLPRLNSPPQQQI